MIVIGNAGPDFADRFRALIRQLALPLVCGLVPGVVGAESAYGSGIEEIVVTSERREQPLIEHAGNIDRLTEDALRQIRHQHLHELLTRVSGVWLSRGSGQENLTAIRSPVLTGAGSCGAFLTLEDSIPTRPAGFCNVNQLVEINTEQADAIEVVRGPGNALFGSNAMHGIVNVIMPTPDSDTIPTFGLELGANEYIRLRARMPLDSNFFAAAVHADDGGFREDSGYQQTKGHLKFRTPFLNGNLIAALSLSDLQQDTAGFIVGANAYEDDSLNRSNPNPEAFRDASSQRLYGIWTRSANGRTIDVRPFLRHSDMTFLQHFLPGQPLEENGHVSAGFVSSVSVQTERRKIVTGLDVEWSDAFLEETQFGPTSGSPFLQETRPTGKHYDYRVDSVAIAPFVHAEFSLGERLTLSTGLRAEHIRYDYDNRMLNGNTRDDGTPCGFGGCLYTRPADRRDEFSNLAPKLSANYLLTPETTLYANYARGFRAPQITELYRLQSGQQVADLDSEVVDSVEFGLRTLRETVSYEVSLYAMRKKDSVLRDADGFSVSGARSRHSGLEAKFDRRIAEHWHVELAASYAKHVYDFDLVALRGEAFVSGNDVDTAPRWLANAELFYEPTEFVAFSLQWTTIGPYFLDAENRFEYQGHDLINMRGEVALPGGFAMIARLNNVADSDIADRADYAFGQYRYFPGRGRELFVELLYRGKRP